MLISKFWLHNAKLVVADLILHNPGA